MANNQYKLEITAETRDAIKALQNLAGAGKDAGTTTTKAAAESSEAWNVFKGVVGAQAFVGAFNAIKGAAGSLFNTFVTDGVKAAQVQENAVNSLSGALKNSGEFSQATLDDFLSFASGMQQVSTVGDETSLKILSLAKSFGLSNEQSKQATEAAIELAAVTGQDVETAFRQINATFSGTAGRIGQLNPRIRELTKEQLENGDAVKILIEDYGGRATDALNTYSGAITQTTNTFGDLQEEIGFAITQNPAVISAIKDLGGVFADLGVFVNENIDVFKEFVAFGVGGLVSSVKLGIDVVKSFSTFVVENLDVIKALGVGMVTAATAIGAYTLAVNAGAIATAAITVATKAWSVALALTPVGLIVTGLTALGAGIYYAAQNWDALTASTKIFTAEVISKVMPAIEYVLNGVSTLVGIFDQDMSKAIQNTVTEIQGYADALRDSGEATQQSIKDQKDAEEAQKALSKVKADAAAEEVAKAQEVSKQKEELKKAELDAEVKFQEDLAKLKAEQEIREQELNLLKLERQGVEDTQRLATLTEQLGREEAIKAEARLRALEAEEQTTEVIRQQALLQEEIKQAALSRQVENQKRANSGIVSLEEARNKKLLEQQTAQEAEEKKLRDGQLLFFMNSKDREADFAALTERQKLDTVGNGFRQIAQLSKSKNREQHEIGKAAAIGAAMIDMYRGAVSAYSSLAGIPIVGPGLGALAAAGVIAAGTANINQIRAQKFSQGGIVGGTAAHGDKTVIRANAGEVILNRAQQNNLAGQLTHGQGMSEVVDELRMLREDVRGLRLTIGDDQIFDASNRELKAGRRWANG
ncbi:MAG: hypothetical protein ACOH5I_21875 [Oligoflexus sp.]